LDAKTELKVKFADIGVIVGEYGGNLMKLISWMVIVKLFSPLVRAWILSARRVLTGLKLRANMIILTTPRNRKIRKKPRRMLIATYYYGQLPSHSQFYMDVGLPSKMFHVKRAFRSWGLIGHNLIELLKSTLYRMMSIA
jgi:hypothetical protein